MKHCKYDAKKGWMGEYNYEERYAINFCGGNICRSHQLLIVSMASSNESVLPSRRLPVPLPSSLKSCSGATSRPATDRKYATIRFWRFSMATRTTTRAMSTTAPTVMPTMTPMPRDEPRGMERMIIEEKTWFKMEWDVANLVVVYTGSTSC